MRLNLSNTPSEARMDAETKGPPTKVINPITMAIIAIGKRILNADFPEAFRMGILHFELIAMKK